MKKLLMAATLVAGIATLALPAMAATTNANCLGKLVSGAAQSSGANLGKFISSIAHADNGVGDVATDYLAQCQG